MNSKSTPLTAAAQLKRLRRGRWLIIALLLPLPFLLSWGTAGAWDRFILFMGALALGLIVVGFTAAVEKRILDTWLAARGVPLKERTGYLVLPGKPPLRLIFLHRGGHEHVYTLEAVAGEELLLRDPLGNIVEEPNIPSEKSDTIVASTEESPVAL